MARAGRSESRYDLVLLVGCAFLGFFVRALPAHLSDPIASTLRRTVLAPLVSLQRGAELTRGALDTYEARTLSLDSLALQAFEARALADENENLREMLTLGARLRWGFIPADALSGTSSAEEFTLTLTAGENAGVRVKSAVIAPEGLVGMVQRVDPTMSSAIIWPHPDFRVSAMDVDGNAFGIVQAHLGPRPTRETCDGCPGEPEQYLLEMRGVAYRSELTPGTEIVSSGLGGVYPKGIRIGTVLGEVETPEGWTRTYLLLPAVHPQDLRSVMILDPERAAEGVQQVWARRTSRDSVVRRIVSASDSIDRLATQAEARRRQAELDSIARAAEAREVASEVPGAPTTGANVPAPAQAQPQTQGRTPQQRPQAASDTQQVRTPAAAPARPAPTPAGTTRTTPPPRPPGAAAGDSGAGAGARPAPDTVERRDTTARRPPDTTVRRDSAGTPVPPAGRDSARPDTASRPDTTRRVPPPPVTVPPPADAGRGSSA